MTIKKNRGEHSSPRFDVLIWISAVTETENIIHTGMVKTGQFDEYLCGDIVLAGFVFGIARLGHAEKSGDLCLVKVGVLTEVAESIAHKITRRKYPII